MVNGEDFPPSPYMMTLRYLLPCFPKILDCRRPSHTHGASQSLHHPGRDSFHRVAPFLIGLIPCTNCSMIRLRHSNSPGIL